MLQKIRAVLVLIHAEQVLSQRPVSLRYRYKGLTQKRFWVTCSIKIKISACRRHSGGRGHRRRSVTHMQTCILCASMQIKDQSLSRFQSEIFLFSGSGVSDSAQYTRNVCKFPPSSSLLLNHYRKIRKRVIPANAASKEKSARLRVQSRTMSVVVNYESVGCFTFSTEVPIMVLDESVNRILHKTYTPKQRASLTFRIQERTWYRSGRRSHVKWRP